MLIRDVYSRAMGPILQRDATNCLSCLFDTSLTFCRQICLLYVPLREAFAFWPLNIPMIQSRCSVNEQRRVEWCVFARLAADPQCFWHRPMYYCCGFVILGLFCKLRIFGVV